MKKQLILSLSLLCVLCGLRGESAFGQTPLTWDKRWLTAMFYGEGAHFGDFNNDGKIDIVSGPFIYDGPDFSLKRAFTEPVICEPLAYSESFLIYTHDFDADGWLDIFVIGFPGKEAFWYRNPQNATGHWERHVTINVVDNESPMLANFVGNAAPELICMSGGHIGYATPDSSDAKKPWTFHPISPKSEEYQRFTHGIGVGDVNGDGRIDLLEKSGWWEQPETLDADPQWTKHAFDFAPGMGSSQMHTCDVDGDGDNDIITALNAHGYGLAWYENVKDADAITFKQHLILSPDGATKLNDVQFSQLHAVEVLDMDGDGLKDILTGKRHWAHGPTGDPEPNAPAVLYWFKLRRESGAARYEAHKIDENSGVGTQITARDINEDKIPDIVVGNKLGTMVMISKP